LGAPIDYTGRPIGGAHQRHRIMGGQFSRRMKILEKTLRAHDAPEWVIAEWLREVERLRPSITGDALGECTSKEPLSRK
ncbi:MAG: hypothetical protein MK135_07205, partial [Polyangiaceae bacterium]|nr:hypothetical protein [Polyangiaceae bacterium]